MLVFFWLAAWTVPGICVGVGYHHIRRPQDEPIEIAGYGARPCEFKYQLCYSLPVSLGHLFKYQFPNLQDGNNNTYLIGFKWENALDIIVIIFLKEYFHYLIFLNAQVSLLN